MSKRLLWSSLLLLAAALPSLAADAEKPATASETPKPAAPAKSAKSATSDKSKKGGEDAGTKVRGKAADKAPRRDVERFPAPLEFVSANITNLEKSGYFHVERVELGRNEEFGDESFFWTIKVERPLTCRMAAGLLDQFRDVRFYDTAQEGRFELLVSRMNYSSRLSERAISNEILGRDELIQLWVTLSIEDRRMLKGRGADIAEFGRIEKHPAKNRSK